jgi:hypothetical protein
MFSVLDEIVGHEKDDSAVTLDELVASNKPLHRVAFVSILEGWHYFLCTLT